jgi:hypothetical protein
MCVTVKQEKVFFKPLCSSVVGISGPAAVCRSPSVICPVCLLSDFRLSVLRLSPMNCLSVVVSLSQKDRNRTTQKEFRRTA